MFFLNTASGKVHSTAATPRREANIESALSKSSIMVKVYTKICAVIKGWFLVH